MEIEGPEKVDVSKVKIEIEEESKEQPDPKQGFGGKEPTQYPELE